MSRLQVVYLGHVAQLSGAEIALRRLLPAIADEVKAHVILAEDGPLVESLRAGGATVEVLPLATIARDVDKDSVSARRGAAGLATARYVGQLRRRLRDLHPDLVHTNSLKAALYGGSAGRLVGIPVIWQIRDRIAPDYLPANAVRLVRGAARLLPTAVIVSSEATAATLPGIQAKTHVVADCVDPTLLVAPTTRDPDRRPLRIGVVGRLAPWKGQHIFIEAFGRAFATDPTVEARVIGTAMFGEDNYAKQLHARAASLDLTSRVEFRGFIPDMARELAELDILVHTSTTPEPFGQVVIEGMAAGLPVVAANTGGPAEIITDGVDGILVRPGDAASLAAVLRRLVDAPQLRRDLGDAATATGASYSPQRTATGVLAVYRRVIAGR